MNQKVQSKFSDTQKFNRKGVIAMRIQKSSVIMDSNHQNILVKDFAKNYSGVDSLHQPENIVKVMNDIFNVSNLAEEYLFLICMTTRCKPISIFEVSHGTCNSSLVGCREIMIRALLCGAVNIVIVHNHPSGNAQPSLEDVKVTKKIKDAFKLIGLNFCDHIIIGQDGYFSFSKANLQ